MIVDAVSAAQVPKNATLAEQAIASFLRFVEKRLNASVIRDARGMAVDSELALSLQLAEQLKESGIVQQIGKTTQFPDEPRMKSWYATCNDPSAHRAGGTTWESDVDALNAALSEGLERYIWMTQNDYFPDPVYATSETIKKYGPSISPVHFAGFSTEERRDRPERELRTDATYRWIRGESLVHKRPVYIPAQVIGSTATTAMHGASEPLIRHQNTIGLATWKSGTGAQLAGALEVIEREAYMIMWLNQLSLPRISLPALCADDPSLERSVSACTRYGLKVHAIQMLTDAPTHAIAVVIEDLSGNAPRFTIGLKAHRNLSYAIQKAMTEALRARIGYRKYTASGASWDIKTPTREIGHRERLYYWGVPEHAKHLAFLIQGPEIAAEERPWNTDDEEAHLKRVLNWCREKNFDCVSVSLGISKKNPTPLSIEMVVLPQLQPTYLMEWVQALGCDRWREVPPMFGYAARQKPFLERPHPFS